MGLLYRLGKLAMYAGFAILAWQVLAAVATDSVSVRWVGIGILTIVGAWIERALIRMWVRRQAVMAAEEFFSGLQEAVNRAREEHNVE